MNLARMLFGLLVLLTAVSTVLALVVGRASDDEGALWRALSGPALMVLVCVVTYRWLRRYEI